MDLTEYRATPAEQQRTEDLLRLIPARGSLTLDIGARDGHFSRLLADRFERVIALDLTEPDIADPRVQCVQGNAANLEFPPVR
jgi:23S rRNA U2552 (ribose-2'-O)-methylase RlmE/FtsJ